MIKEKDKTESDIGSVFEGIVSFRAVLESGRRIKKLYYDREKLQKNAKEFSFIKAKSAEKGFEIILSDRSGIDALSVGSSHGGIVFECEEKETPFLKECDVKENGFYVLLEGIEDPYNYGYALRTVYSAGADGIILTRKNWRNAEGIVCRASAGASEAIPQYLLEKESDVAFFGKKGYKIVCAEKENAVPMYDADLKKPLLLAVGGERRGLSSFLLENADMKVSIEYGREFKAALSSASAASVLSYEVYRQNRFPLDKNK